MYNSKYYYYLLAALLFTWFFTWASAFSLIPIWMDQVKGLDAPQIGLFFTFQSVTALCMQPMYGYIQDKLGLKKHLLLVAGCVLAGAGPMYLFVVSPLMDVSKYGGAMLGGAYCGLALLAGIGVLESYTERVSRIVGFEYGKCRAVGSVGYAAGAFCAGYAFGINPNANFYMALTSALFFVMILIALRPVKPEVGKGYDEEKVKSLTLKDAFALLTLSRMWCLIFFMIAVAVYGVYDQQFAIHFSRQFDTPEQGNAAFAYLNSLQVFLEAGMLFLAPFIVNRIGVRNGLLVAGYVMAFRVFGSGIVEGPVMISFMKLLHAVELPILLVAMFKYITSRFDNRLSSTIYLVVFQFSGSIFSTVLSFGAGKIYAALGFETAYLVLGVLVAVIVTISGFLLVSDNQAKAENMSNS